MAYDGSLRLMGQLAADLAAGGRQLDSEIGYLDPAVYTDPDRFAAEWDLLFRRQPLLAGHGSMLPDRGSVMTEDRLGIPMILARGRDGRVRGFVNACRHRNTRVLAPGTARRMSSLVCPYHNWVYGLEGELRHIPCAEDGFPGLDPAGYGLAPIPCMEHQGWLWLQATPRGRMDLDGHLGGLAEDFDALGIAGLTLFRQHAVTRRTNWKLVVDAFLEVYHVKRLHSTTIGPYFLDTSARFETVGRHIRAAVGRTGFEEVRRRPQAEWDDRSHVTLVHYVFPNTILVFHPDYVSQIALYPVSPDETVFVHSLLVPPFEGLPDADKARAHYERSFALIDGEVFNKEDLAVCEAAQSAMRSGANERLTLGRFELGVRLFHRILEEALAPGVPAGQPPGLPAGATAGGT